MLPVLYSFRRCPYAMRARLALLTSGVAYELREVVLRNKPDSMLKASPKGSVPVLALPDGCVIDESWDITSCYGPCISMTPKAGSAKVMFMQMWLPR